MSPAASKDKPRPPRRSSALRGDSDNEVMAFSARPAEDAELEAEMAAAYAAVDQQRIQANAGDASDASGSDGLQEDGKPPSGPRKQRLLLPQLLNISHVLTDAGKALANDSFSRCFTSMVPDPWNWNVYLWIQWVFGVALRHCVIFPLRAFLLLLANIVFFILFFGVALLVHDPQRRQKLELPLVQFLCCAWLMAWNAVVKYHGPRPTPGPHRVWVSNHTSMIDYVILCAHSPFAVIMQLHTGWIRFLQTRVLSSLGCLWFNRTDIKDRHKIAEGMKQHVNNPNSVPLLIFPEGTCVNNEYCIQFKRGAFDLGATVCPIAIKYNKIFVDAFWNSRRQAFGHHLFRLMTSWALVCDVWFLEPQVQRPGEAPDEFATRVQRMIAETAGLKATDWDGYLKYYNLGQAKPGLIEARRKVVADALKSYLPGSLLSSSKPSAAEPAPAPPAANEQKKDR